MKRVFWDLETLESWDEGNETFGQYTDHAGVSVACIMGDKGVPSFFTPGDKGEHSLESLASLLESVDEVVSYNGRDFDTHVLSQTIGRPINVRMEVDLLRCIEAAVGRFRGKGLWKLATVCQRTLNLTKDDDGAYAPQKWREQRLGDLFTYNYWDVELTRRLHQHIAEKGYVVGPDYRTIDVTLQGT